MENLKADIKDLAHDAYLIMGEHFDETNPEHQVLIQKLDAMENRAKNLNTDFDKVLENTLSETEIKYSLLRSKMDNETENLAFQSTEKITDKFNTQSSGDQSLNKQHEQELQLQNSVIQKPVGMNL